MMPGESGVQLTEHLRASNDRVPVLMLSALADTGDRIAGLQSGSDDYLAKPFEPKELLLRIQNLIRRSETGGRGRNDVFFGGFTFNRSVAQIAVDPWSPRFREPQRAERLGGILAHELCHLARFRHPASAWSTRHMSRSTLGHSLIAEGLSQAFEEEMGFPCPYTALAVQREPLWDLGARAMAHFDDAEFDHDAWFLGRRDDPAFPRFGGYSLGYAIVRAWLMMMETAPSEEIGLETPEVLTAWRTGRLDI